jgi:hypothetical protein
MLDLETTEHMLRIYRDYGMIVFGLSAVSLVLIAVQGAISRRAMTPGGLPYRVTTLIVVWFMVICNSALLFLSATVMILWLNKSQLTNHAQLISRMSNPAFLPSALVLGASFYRLKRSYPSLYGIVELSPRRSQSGLQFSYKLTTCLPKSLLFSVASTYLLVP